MENKFNKLEKKISSPKINQHLFTTFFFLYKYIFLYK